MVLRTHSRSSGNISSNLSAEKMPSLKRLRVFGWKPLDGKTAEGGLLFLINRPASCLWDCPNPRSLWIPFRMGLKLETLQIYRFSLCLFIIIFAVKLQVIRQTHESLVAPRKWDEADRWAPGPSAVLWANFPLGWLLWLRYDYDYYYDYYDYLLFFDMIIPTWMCVPWIASG